VSPFFRCLQLQNLCCLHKSSRRLRVTVLSLSAVAEPLLSSLPVSPWIADAEMKAPVLRMQLPNPAASPSTDLE